MIILNCFCFALCVTLVQDEDNPFEKRLQTALEDRRANPEDPNTWIWVGRHQAYLGRYEAAIETFSQGLEKFPQDARFLRHRGHRWITMRKFDKAIQDLEAAVTLIEGTEDQIEPDGVPNAAGIPTSTLHTNIWYHLGLARFLQGDFQKASEAYHECLKATTNDDMRVATLDWQYMTLRRLDRTEEAETLIADIGPELKILENHAYHRRILLYRGLLKPTDLLPSAISSASDATEETGQAKADNDSRRSVELATNGFGVGHWYLLQGDREKARAIFTDIVKHTQPAAFGHIAAEVELQRMK